MLKLTVAVLAVVLAGTASAAGWRPLRLDGSSEASFMQSLAVLQDKLSPSRRHAFELAMQDIWRQGVAKATEAGQREYTAAEYRGQLDGLGYEEVVTFTDPTGETAKRYRAAYYYARSTTYSGYSSSGDSPWPAIPVQTGFQGQTLRGGDSYRYPMQ